MKNKLILSVFACVVLSSQASYAQCSGPAAIAGSLNYDSSSNVYEYCNGTSWNSIGGGGGGSPAGSTGAIQFNNAGSFGGDANFLFTSAGQLLVGTNVPFSNELMLIYPQNDFAPVEFRPALYGYNYSAGTLGTKNTVGGIYGIAETATIGAGTSTALGVGGLGEATNDAKSQFAIGVQGKAIIHNTDIGYAFQATDGDTNPSTGGTMYGLHISLDDTDTTNYGIYQSTANPNYFAGNMGIGAAPAAAALTINGDWGSPTTWSVAQEISDGSYGASSSYNATVGLVSYVENAVTGTGFTEAFAIRGEPTAANDAKSQYVYGVLGNPQVHNTDFGYSLYAADENTSTGGTVFGLYINLDDTDVARYGIYQTTANDNYLAGRLGIGEDTPDVALDVTGDINYTGVIQDVSDRRLKTNILSLEGSLDKLVQLNGYSFTMKDDEAGVVEYGLMAQDVQPLFPELVTTQDDGFMRLNYLGLIAPMIEATKAQQEQIAAQKARIDEQQALIAALMNRIEALEAAD